MRELDKRGGPNAISRPKNALFAAMSRVIPRKLVMNMMSRSMKN